VLLNNELPDTIIQVKIMGPFYRNKTTFLTFFFDAVFVSTVFFSSAYSPTSEKTLLETVFRYVFMPFCIWGEPFLVFLSKMGGRFSQMGFVFFVSLVPAFIYAWLFNRLFSLIHSDLTYFQKKNQGKI